MMGKKKMAMKRGGKVKGKKKAVKKRGGGMMEKAMGGAISPRKKMAMGMMGGGMSINGAAMDMNVINERVPVGQWEIWEIANASMMAHPFHIHNVQFRVIDRDGRAPPPLETSLKDTVIVNPREQVRLLLRFEEHTDPDLPYMYHCHILEHEDAGMMGQFVVVKS